MKHFFSKASVMLIVFALAVVATSCNSYSDEQQTTTKETITVKNTLRGVILDQNGAALTGATVTINGKSVAVTGNTFGPLVYNDGTYTVVAKAAGYKDSEPKDVALAKQTQLVDGELALVGQDVECVIYMYKEETKTVNIGSTADSQTVTIETSTQDDGTGNTVGNTQDPTDVTLNSEITVTGEVPALDATQVSAVETQLPSGTTIDDVSFTLTNLTSLAEARRGATRSIIVAGEALPDNFTFFTGVKLTTTQKVNFSSLGITVDVTIELPKDVKDVVKLYRLVGTASTWTEVTASTTGNGIAVADFSGNDKIVIKLNVLENQSFALGAQIDQSETASSTEAIVASPVVNNGATPVAVANIDYKAKEKGVVLKNLTKGSMVDYLRKMVLRYYGIRSIYEAKETTFTYNFTPAYSLAANGQLYLAGFQNVETSVFKIANGTSSFQAQEYGDVFVYPYAIVPEVPNQHGGGSND